MSKLEIVAREDVLRDLHAYASRGSGVVIGAPGVGKSTLLRDLHRRLREQGSLTLMVPIDMFGTNPDEELHRLLQYEGDLIEWLQQGISTSERKPGFLIFDAFDTARKAQTQKFFLGLIRRAVGRLEGAWNVIVAVRTFDAKRSQELLNLFGEPLPADNFAYSERDVHCRHFKVPPLDDAEVEGVIAGNARMRSAYDSGTPELRDLLHIPFHLWLLHRITAVTGDAADWSQIRSETQLLGLFWWQRVSGTDNREDREAVLRRVTEKMVQQQQLSASRSDTYIHQHQEAWRELFSDGILGEDPLFNGHLITFAHNILFDYAVSIVYLEEDAESLMRTLSEEIARPFFLRPSLVYYFTRLWYDARSRFWPAFWLLLTNESSEGRLVARLLPPAVIASEARDASDWSPVLTALERDEQLSTQAVLRILQALLMLDVRRDELWTLFLEGVSRYLDRSFAWDVGLLTGQILARTTVGEHAVQVTQQCGVVARNLLEWVWVQRLQAAPLADALGAAWGVPLVTRTFATDPDRSRALLAPVVHMINDEAFPIQWLYRLVDDVDHIWGVDPDFVGTIYQAVFTHVERSDETTPLGGPVLPLSSTRRQDFSLCQFVLIQHAAGFLQAALVPASKAIIVVLNQATIVGHVLVQLLEGRTLDDVTATFRFRGKDVKYVRDLSSIWDRGRYADDMRQLADSLFAYVDAVVSSDDVMAINQLLDVFRDHAAVAMLWARLLRAGAQAPEAFASLLFELCVSRPIQTGSDTTRDLGQFLLASAAFMPKPQLAALEMSLLRLPAQASDARELEYLERVRSRLLAKIPSELLQTEEARQIQASHQSAGTLAEDSPTYGEDVEWVEIGTSQQVREQTAAQASVANNSATSGGDQLDAFVRQWFNDRPTPDAIAAILPIAQAEWALVSQDLDADAERRNRAWKRVASCCEAISRGPIDPNAEAFWLCRAVLLASSEHPEPHRSSFVNDETYDSPSWAPDPRNEAARGLPRLAAIQASNDIVEAIGRLVQDAVPSVRFLVTEELYAVERGNPQAFWRLAEDIAGRETNQVVQMGLCHSLWRVATKDEARTAAVAERLVARLLTSQDPPRLLKPLVSLIVGLALARSNQWASGVLDEVLAHPNHFADTLSQAIFDALNYVKADRLSTPDEVAEARRALAWIMRALDAAAVQHRQLRTEAVALTKDGVQSGMQTLFRCIDQVVARFLFDADVDPNLRSNQRRPLSDAHRRRYYALIKPVLEKVLDISGEGSAGVLLAPTAHHMMRLLRGVLRIDPQGVLHLAARVATASEAAGFTIDSLAVHDMVELVEAVLADYRSEVRRRETMSNLLAMLDVFARAGWPEALRLIWRLDEVFR